MKKQRFLRIINSNKGVIRSLCNIYYNNNEDRKDAFQDIVLQLWKAFDTFRGGSKISTWIYRVGINTILTKKRRDKKSICTRPLELSHHNICTGNADDNLELLYMIIQSLKDIEKAIVLLYLEGYRSKEIAEILKISPSNVTTRFNRIKSQLIMKFNKKSYATK